MPHRPTYLTFIPLVLILSLSSLHADLCANWKAGQGTPQSPVKIMGGSIDFVYDNNWKKDPSGYWRTSDNKTFSTFKVAASDSDCGDKPPSKITTPWKITVIAQKENSAGDGVYGEIACTNFDPASKSCVLSNAQQGTAVTLFSRFGNDPIPATPGQPPKLTYQGFGDDGRPCAAGKPCRNMSTILIEWLRPTATINFG